MDLAKKRKKAGIGKLSRQRLSKVLRLSRGSCITVKTVVEFLKISPVKARRFLSSWTKNGWMNRIRHGVYVPVDIKAESIDQSFTDPWIVANDLFAPCYIGGWSAAQYWDFTEQIFESTFIITSRHINGKKHLISEMVFLIKKASVKKIFGLKTVWKDQIKIQVSDPHKTIIDMLDDPVLGGGIRLTIDCFQKYITSSYFDSNTLIEYALKMNNKVIFKRLGFILSKIKPDAIDLIEYCKKNMSQGNSQLDPNAKGYNLITKWKLWIPEGLMDAMDSK